MDKIRKANEEYKENNNEFLLSVSALIHLDNLTNKLQNFEDM